MFHSSLIILMLLRTFIIAHPDAGLNVIQLIKKYGYPVEQHKNIETEDGYLLEMHRIPHGKNNSRELDKPAVLLMHGLLSSSADWVNMGPEKSLGFLLADLGYDVWLGNARGNTWSRKHVKYNPNGHDFWMFSWNEIGLYDLPKKIDYIINCTKQEKIYYVGHSQGTTSFFVMGSERPEYNKKIKLMVALAPVAYMSNTGNRILKGIAKCEEKLEWILGLFGYYEFMPKNGLFDLLGKNICKDLIVLQSICAHILFLYGGHNSVQFDITTLPVITSNAPAGASTRQVLHYAQGINSGKFRKYDHGKVENRKIYGNDTPPDYSLDRITVPVALFYSENDKLADAVDVDHLYKELPQACKYQVENQCFNHFDFLWAIDVKELLYNDVFTLLNRCYFHDECLKLTC